MSDQATSCACCGEHRNTPLRIDRAGGYVCLSCVDARITALEAENARLRVDADRYAWIRDKCYPHEYLHRDHSHVVVSVYLGDDDRGRARIMHPGKETKVGIPSLDSAIDAARG